MHTPFRNVPTDSLGVSLALLLVGAALLSFLFSMIDLLILCFRPRLLVSYFLLLVDKFRHSPYGRDNFERLHVSRLHHRSTGEFAYGETPVFVALYLFFLSGVGPKTRFIDVGSGRGSALVSAVFLGSAVVGVEIVPSHAASSRKRLSCLGVNTVVFDAALFDYSSYDVVYLPWVCFSQKTREDIVCRLAFLRSGARVICLHWAIDDDRFVDLRHGVVPCSWGVSRYYLYVRR